MYDDIIIQLEDYPMVFFRNLQNEWEFSGEAISVYVDDMDSGFFSYEIVTEENKAEGFLKLEVGKLTGSEKESSDLYRIFADRRAQLREWNEGTEYYIITAIYYYLSICSSRMRAANA